MKQSALKYIVAGFFVVIAQIMIFRHLRVWGAESDVVLIFLMWLMSYQDRTKTLFFAAGLGLFQDALLDLWGLHMFAKVAMVMICYNFVPKADESKPQVPQLIALISLVTLIHNFIFLGASGFTQSLATWANFWPILIGNTIFTAIIGTFIYIFRTDKS